MKTVTVKLTERELELVTAAVGRYVGANTDVDAVLIRIKTKLDGARWHLTEEGPSSPAGPVW